MGDGVARHGPGPGPAEPARTALIVVRRGQSERFRRLQEEFARESAQIIWDRRVAERRRPGPSARADRRHGERRRMQEEEFLVGLAEDRRTSPRREGGEAPTLERRRGERRRLPPESWTALDCVVVGASPRRPGGHA